MQKNARKILLAAPALFFGLFGLVSTADAAGNLCCLYFKGAQSDQCHVYDKESGQPVKIGDENLKAEVFSCSQYDKKTNTIKDFVLNLGNKVESQDVNDAETVAPINLEGGYFGNIEDIMKFNKATAVGSCFPVENYSLVMVKMSPSTLDEKYYVPMCELAYNKLKLNTELNSLIKEEINKELNKAKDIYSKLQEISSKICCVPKIASPDSSCHKPAIKPQITADINSFVNGSEKQMPASLMNFESISPDTYNNPEIGKISQFYTCDEGVGTGWESAYYLSGYSCAYINEKDTLLAVTNETATGIATTTDIFVTAGEPMCKQRSYYCLCRKDGKGCAKKWYAFLEKKEDNTSKSQIGCQQDLAFNDGMEPGEWECIATKPPSDIAKGNYCGHLIGPEYISDEYKGIPFEIPSTEGLNLLGAKDFPTLIGRVIKAMMGIIGSISLAMFVYSGIMWMTASGNSEREEKSKKILVWSSLGVIVIFASYAMLNFVFEVVK